MGQSLFLRTALTAARAAEVVVRKYYKSGLAAQLKADASPVTQADVESEAAIRAVLSAEFPEHGFYGEELGQESLDADYVWLIDPIDGTKAFVRGYPLFSVQIALMHKGEIIVGVSTAPCWNMETGETAYAERGQGAYLNGQRVSVSTIGALEEATLSTGNLASLARSERWGRYGALIPRLHRVRGYGDFLHYHWLASGKLDAVIESDVSILDVAALSVIVREAGGDFTDLDGQPLTLKTTSVLATNGRLRTALQQALG